MSKYNKDPWWAIAEKRAADYFGGSLVRGSGRGYYKSDVYQTEVIGGKTVTKQYGYRVEVKSTVNMSMSFEIPWLIKIIAEAKKYRQHPAFFLLFGDNNAFALIPCDLEEEDEQPTPENTIHLDGKTKQLDAEYLSRFKYIRLNPLILTRAQLPKDCMYIWWKIEEEG